MRILTTLSLCAAVLISQTANADIPYKMRAGIEEVDYAKLNPIKNFKLPDSGQFRETTWIKGEDRDYSRHPISFTISDDDQVVIDNNTGMMWERYLNWNTPKVVPAKGKWRPQDVFTYKDGEPKRRPYHEGVQYCKSLELGGYSDWRMPNIKEAQTITHYASARPTIWMKYFKDVFAGLPGYGDRGKGGMWAGPIGPDHNNSGWHMGLIDGHFMGYPRGGYKTTRCVRADNNGGYFDPVLTDNNDGTATDSQVKLMWIKKVESGLLDWEASLQYCENLEFAGHKDWKLPHNKESTSIVELNKFKPALNETLFADTNYKAFYWTRTPETRDAARNLMSESTVQPEDIEVNNATENAWLQEFMLGATWRAPRTKLAYARCMRWTD